jgi:hypothetical protein
VRVAAFLIALCVAGLVVTVLVLGDYCLVPYHPNHHPGVLPMRQLFLIAVLLMGTTALPQDDSAPFPEKAEPRLMVNGVSFAEGPTFDSKGNLFFVNYKGNGNIGRRTPAGETDVWLKIPDPAPGPGGKSLHAGRRELTLKVGSDDCQRRIYFSALGISRSLPPRRDNDQKS